MWIYVENLLSKVNNCPNCERSITGENTTSHPGGSLSADVYTALDHFATAIDDTFTNEVNNRPAAQ